MVSFFTVYRFTVKSSESHLARKQSYVTRNFWSSRPTFYHAQQHPNILIAPVPFHQIFQNKISYSFISLVSSHHHIKNEICCTFVLLFSGLIIASLLKERDFITQLSRLSLLFTIAKARYISYILYQNFGNLTKYPGRHNSGFGQHDFGRDRHFRAT